MDKKTSNEFFVQKFFPKSVRLTGPGKNIVEILTTRAAALFHMGRHCVRFLEQGVPSGLSVSSMVT